MPAPGGGEAQPPSRHQPAHDLRTRAHRRTRGRASRGPQHRAVQADRRRGPGADWSTSGLLRRVGRTSGLPGPSAQLYDVNPRAGWVLSLDVGRVWVRAALVDLTGAVAGRCAMRTPRSTAKAVISQLRQAAETLAGEAGISLDERSTRSWSARRACFEGAPTTCRSPLSSRVGRAPRSSRPYARHWSHPSSSRTTSTWRRSGSTSRASPRTARTSSCSRSAPASAPGSSSTERCRRGAAGLAGEIGFLPLDIDAQVRAGHRATWGTGGYESLVGSAAIVETLAREHGAALGELGGGDLRRRSPR